MATLFNAAGEYLDWAGSGAIFEPNDVGTICFWAYPITDGGASYASLVAWNNCELDQRQNTTPDVWRPVVNNTGIAGGSSYSYNTWYFVAAIRSTKTLWKFYVNAVADLTVTTDVTATGDQTVMQIGTYNSGDTQPFGGRIANVIAWTVALSEDQLAAQMRQLAPVQWGSIWCWLRMENGALGTDSSGQGNDFTAVGTPTYAAGPSIPLVANEDEELLLLL